MPQHLVKNALSAMKDYLYFLETCNKSFLKACSDLYPQSVMTTLSNTTLSPNTKGHVRETLSRNSSVASAQSQQDGIKTTTNETLPPPHPRLCLTLTVTNTQIHTL